MQVIDPAIGILAHRKLGLAGAEEADMKQDKSSFPEMFFRRLAALRQLVAVLSPLQFHGWEKGLLFYF